MNSSRFEQYLDEVEKPLKGLTPEAQGEWREEARQHLAELAAAHEELGSSPEQAVDAAVHQFGSAGQIGKQLRRSLLGQQPKRLDGKAAFALFSVPVIVSLCVMIGFGYAYVLSESAAALDAMRFAGACAFVAVPIIGGWRVGKREQQQGERGLPLRVLGNLLLSAFACVPIAGVLALNLSFGVGHGADPDLRLGLLWLPIAALSALRANRSRLKTPPLS